MLDPWRERDACGVGFVARADGGRGHDILALALTAVARLAHRGAASNDKSGDGAGVLTQIPHRLLGVGPVERVALGMFFLPQAGPARDIAIDLIETVLVSLGMSVLGWRVVPVDAAVLGPLAATSQPTIRQLFIGPPAGPANAQAWERRLYLARRVIERRAASAGLQVFVCSLSCRTVVYKALLVGTELPGFYADLQSPLFETGIAVFHQRYSTNTLPSWPLAQPFRLLAHNGEINTLWGNRNAMRAREPALAAPAWERDVEQLKPVIWEDGSDSTSLDNAFELLVRSGRDPVHALMMLLPEAWERIPEMHPALRSFYEYHAGLMEPWDGPAALAFSDGVIAGSALDRNGLRPCRYKVTRDNTVVAGSEVGIVDLDPPDVVESGRLGPGELLVVDTLRNVVLRSADAKMEVAQRFPYLSPMAAEGRDAVWSMGDDTPIAPLSRLPQSLYAYVRQRFAQVTNPAIDPLREELVMSLVMYLGRRGSVLAQRPGRRTLLRIEHPVLLAEEMAALRRAGGAELTTLSAVWEAAAGPEELARALETLSRDAVKAVRRGGGATILVISDRDADKTRAPIPMLLAIGAVHQRLVQAGQRIRVGLVAEAGDAWDVHHFAALFGYGAEVVHPWLALQCPPLRDAESSAEQYRGAAEKGLLKILSKMGISTLQSYVGAQIFEAIGLGQEVMDRCFTGTASIIGGIGFKEIAEDVLRRHQSTGVLPDHGRVRYRPLHEVEPAEEIRRRFISSAMSLGALSPEAHETLAIAMNRMHARSNSGEGGEDPTTYATRGDGERADNRIKQVASGRFGVTTAYLVRADELEIKIAQGSKPGEGGQLPGHKVTDLIARLRHAVVGIPLISPPPHHDIYSIEDLAQLIHDLKQVNPAARVGVKLVAEAGVGTVAAGVAKAYADYVLISGHNGGTGASPLSSIKHAGSPWELGLAETQAILMRNKLRQRIEVRVDGGLRTGRDVVIAALLGAESFGFGTATVVALGCAMARQCHLNTCPTGIATQRPELRAKFRGTPEQVVAYFTHIAEDVRRIMASLGVRRMDDLVGRVELLRRIDRPENPRARLLDLSALLSAPASESEPRRRMVERNVRPGLVSLDAEILERKDGTPRVIPIGNHHLTVGARIAGDIARVQGGGGPGTPLRLRFRGSAGQSFGAFTLPRMTLHLEGEANDHVGKGLCGGEIVIRPFHGAAYAGGSHVLLGNTALYGATSGRLFAAGGAGDRFAVRNSGAIAVIEGAGDHCCEYMTGGVVVVLGPVGRNFAAGMSNGIAYVLDERGMLESRCNLEMVAVGGLNTMDERVVRKLVQQHFQKTGSARARTILGQWVAYRVLFRKVAPPALATVEQITAPAPVTSTP
ncbi:MAG: hypothetical protein AUI09_05270 [Gemmatimonadetes bacterium 13_2_20CM_2_66_5]|nr:MAG: hypothetical protein AUI09_05270 [Gemmatimonadetes bacterium 13_2_20CM_2_66_5]